MMIAPPFSHTNAARSSQWEELSAELTEEEIGPLRIKTRSPHPPASAGTFSL
jgi:hypothetical protein